VVEDDGAAVVVFEGELVGVLAGTEEGGEAGVEGGVGVVLSDVSGVVSFFSPVAGADAGASLSEEGFILSE